MTTAADLLPGVFSDVAVQRDAPQQSPTSGPGAPDVIWVGAGEPPVFVASTGIRRDNGPQDQADAARVVLARAGWSVVGSWEMVPTGMVVAVARA